jgi:hypothetical protein
VASGGELFSGIQLLVSRAAGLRQVSRPTRIVVPQFTAFAFAVLYTINILAAAWAGKGL